MKISIIIPVFNEAETILEVFNIVKKAAFGFDAEREIIIVDDGSTDATADILRNISGAKIISFDRNIGKGAAIKKGFEASSGDYAVIQDADLEYSPNDYPALLMPIIERRADVVFGTRFRGSYQRVLYFWHYLGNSFLTLLSNALTNLNLSDMEVGYKVFSREVVQSITPRLKSKRFGIEPELTARVAHGNKKNKKQWKIYEVPIHYDGRTYAEGKKIVWWDGVKAIFAIFYFNIIDR